MKKIFLGLCILLLVFTAASSEFILLEDDKEVWQYYAPEKSLEASSNYFNVLIEESAEDLLRDQGWRNASGTERYAYFNGSEEDKWKTSDLQLEKGNYHGNRHHIRIYESPWSDHELIQAHYEHFNWLTLRHEVTSNEKAMKQAKNDLERAGLELEKKEKDFGLMALTASMALALAVTVKSQKILFFAIFPVIIIGSRATGIILSEFISNPYFVTAPIYMLIVASIFFTILRYAKIFDKLERGLIVTSAILLGFALDAVYTGGIPLNEMVQKTGFAFVSGLLAYFADGLVRNKFLAGSLYVLWLLIVLTGAF